MIQTCSSSILVLKVNPLPVSWHVNLFSSIEQDVNILLSVLQHHVTSTQIPGGRRPFEGHFPFFPNINFDSWGLSSTPLALKANGYIATKYG